ncbi:hypothetical protein CCP4SC76_6100004 [Gammaproteobacteria bacterium]
MHASVGFRGETRTAIVYLLENVVEVYVQLRVAPLRSSGARRTAGWLRQSPWPRPLNFDVRRSQPNVGGEL